MKIASIMFAVLITSIFICFILENKETAFRLSLVTAFFVGVTSALGDSVIFGFMKVLPAKSYAGYSAGTGLSGVVGATLPIITTFVGFQIQWVRTVVLKVRLVLS